MAERDEEIDELEHVLVGKDKEIEELKQTLAEKEEEIEELETDGRDYAIQQLEEDKRYHTAKTAQLETLFFHQNHKTAMLDLKLRAALADADRLTKELAASQDWVVRKQVVEMERAIFEDLKVACCVNDEAAVGEGVAGEGVVAEGEEEEGEK